MMIKFDCDESVWDGDILYHCDLLGSIRDRDRDDDYEDETWYDEYYDAHRDGYDL